MIRKTRIGPCPHCGFQAAYLSCAHCGRELLHCPDCFRVHEAGIMGKGDYKGECLCDSCLLVLYPYKEPEPPGADCARCRKSCELYGGEGGFMSGGGWKDKFLCNECIGVEYPLPKSGRPMDCGRCARRVEHGAYKSGGTWDGRFLCAECLDAVHGEETMSV